MNQTKLNRNELFGKDNSTDNEAFKKWLYLIANNWLLITVFIVLGTSIAFFVNRYTVPIYKATASVIIKPERKSALSETMLMSGFESDVSETFINQTILLKTPSKIKKTLDHLDFNICYFSSGRFNEREFYPEKPFNVQIDSTHVQPLNVKINLKSRQDGKLYLTASAEEVLLYNFKTSKVIATIENFKFDQEFEPGKKYTTDNYSFSISPTATPLNTLSDDGQYYFVFKSTESMIREYSNLSLDYAAKGATVVYLFHSSTCLEKSVAFLNQLIEDWKQSDLDKKNEMANNTIDFISKQLEGLGDTLQNLNTKLRNFRTLNKVVTPEVQLQSSYVKLEAIDAEELQLQLQKSYLNQLESYLNNREDYNKLMAPSVVGLDGGKFGEYLSQLSEIRGELYQSMGQDKLNNPYLVSLRKKENILMASIMEYIRNYNESINLKRKTIASHKERYTQEQNKLPAKEQELFGIERSFKMADALFTMLQEKGIEAKIKKSSNTADNQIVERATFLEMVKPETGKIYGISMLISLLLPLLYLLIVDFFDNKIKTREDLQRLTQAPVFGSITWSEEEANFVTMEKPRSSTSEAFRALRTRLNFLTKEHGQQTIMISSSMPGEGKTFCAINLAGIMALSGKKTLIMGMDLRKPRLDKHLVLPSNTGLTNYLINEATIEEIIQPTAYPHLDCILSGPIPPNPAELITTERMKELFVHLKERYDYIIIDTSPVGLVTDALLISPFCTAMLYVVRHKYTTKQLFAYNIGLIEESQIPNLGLLMNGIKTRKNGYGYGYGSGYGYGYGYGYGEDESKKSRRFSIRQT